MIESLHIRNFAIIDSLQLDFEAGLSALTGETGAGKSILLDAIKLVAGDRARRPKTPGSAGVVAGIDPSGIGWVDRTAGTRPSAMPSIDLRISTYTWGDGLGR